MNAIMYSSNPKQTARVLNKEQTVIILKSIPVEWKEWLKDQSKPFPKKEIYLYCTKGKDYVKTGNRMFECSYVSDGFKPFIVNGKVVAKCVVEKIDVYPYFDEPDEFETVYDEQTGQSYTQCSPLYGKGIYITGEELEKTCLTYEEIFVYSKNKTVYGLHLTHLEIFDRPRELGEFHFTKEYKKAHDFPEWWDKPITHAPQSWMYCEVEDGTTDMEAISDTNKLADNLKTMERLKKESEEK